MTLAELLPLNAEPPRFDSPDLAIVAERIVAARRNRRPVVMMMGAHVIKVGLSRFVIDLMARGIVTHVAMNGAGPIHDYELALIGATTESVASYIQVGQFGLWQETSNLNDILRQAAHDGIGHGEGVGRAIEEGALPYRETSILAAGYRLGVPVTVHIGVGYDIIHEHPNCDGAALGATSYHDFLAFAHTIGDLEGGVMLNFGTAVMGPEVYLKALAMARNVAQQEEREICHFTTAVFDLIPLNRDIHQEAAKSDHLYYYRPYKTILVRTVADGGESFYIQGDHRATLINLYRQISEKELKD
jgi:hypothetical protein